ncbi:hypothetical protein HDV57DRAFT_202958 [Trichoderma longibrachiatum]|uniref:Uncharacterized protein n=1 Tax=Trichoderma longibrachiatum ATCC 18648 TaxID=983965 RepID=A0A2T4C864_TRILO|nr:hypothetical protein M440DRAFT_291298 [Trichoderma longibrachiatum ATCC 18648]
MRVLACLLLYLILSLGKVSTVTPSLYSPPFNAVLPRKKSTWTGSCKLCPAVSTSSQRQHAINALSLSGSLKRTGPGSLGRGYRDAQPPVSSFSAMLRMPARSIRLHVDDRNSWGDSTSAREHMGTLSHQTETTETTDWGLFDGQEGGTRAESRAQRVAFSSSLRRTTVQRRWTNQRDSQARSASRTRKEGKPPAAADRRVGEGGVAMLPSPK